jgi:hypothetical protein
MRNELPLDRVHVHVMQFLDELALTPQIEIVEPRLPELRQEIVGWNLSYRCRTEDALAAGSAGACTRRTPSGMIHLELPKGQLRIAGRVDAEALRVVLEKLLA